MEIRKLMKGLLLEVESIRKCEVNIKIGIISILITAFILVIPTDPAEFSVYAWIQNFLVVIIGLFAVSLFSYLFARLLGAKISPERFISVTNSMFAASLLLVSMPLLLIVILVLNLKMLGAVLFSLVPYYNFIVYGIAAESVSELKGAKATFVALFSMTLIFLFYFLLAFITV